MGDGYTHARPFDAAFYGGVAKAAGSAVWSAAAAVSPMGLLATLKAGDLLELTLEDGPQILHLDAWAAADATDRLWPQETSGVEGCFIGVGHRLWSTMPRYRPLLAVVADSLDEPRAARGEGRHHLVLSGWDTPATWAREGGAPGVVTSWERFRALSEAHGIDPGLHRDAVSLFQRTVIDPDTGILHREPSLAEAGDRIVLYAETDVAVALVPSPWRDGGRPARGCDGTVATTSVRTAPSGQTPLGWPTPGVPYPDITHYLEARR